MRALFPLVRFFFSVSSVLAVIHNLYKIIKYRKSYDVVGGLMRLKVTPNGPTEFFPFSKPSPFSSMTDWHVGTTNKQ